MQAWEQELLDDGKDSLYLAAGGYLLARMELSSVTQTGSHEFRENPGAWTEALRKKICLCCVCWSGRRIRRVTDI